MASWEYLFVKEANQGIDNMQLRLSAFGSLGWEMCGIVNTALGNHNEGINAYTAILKREVTSYASPTDSIAAWCPDPSGRAEQRFWDGLRWTEHVSTKGVQAVDHPNVR